MRLSVGGYTYPFQGAAGRLRHLLSAGDGGSEAKSFRNLGDVINELDEARLILKTSRRIDLDRVGDACRAPGVMVEATVSGDERAAQLDAGLCSLSIQVIEDP